MTQQGQRQEDEVGAHESRAMSSWRGLALEPIWPLLALAALAIFHVSANAFWLRRDMRPPFYDTAGNAITAIELARQPFITMPLVALRKAFSVGPYPPLVHLTTLPFTYFTQPDADTATWAITAFFVLLLCATYLIGKQLGSGQAGILSALVVSLYPIIYGLSRHLLLDVPLTAMVTVAVAAMIWSDYFATAKRSVIVGLCLGLGMLTKWTFAVFVAGPGLVVLIVLARQARRSLIHAGLAGVIGLSVAGPWYVLHRGALLNFLQTNGWLAARLEGDPGIASVQSWAYYLVELLHQQLLLPFVLLFGMGLVLLLRKRRCDLGVCILLAWIVVPYLAFSLFSNKDTRYTMPYLPAFALITGLGLATIRIRWLSWALTAVIFLIAAPQFLTLTAVPLSQTSGGRIPATIDGHAGPLPWRAYGEQIHIAAAPTSEAWQIQPILTRIMDDGATRIAQGEVHHVLILPNLPHFEAQTFRYEVKRQELPLTITFVTGIVETDNEQIMNEANYVVAKSGELGPVWTLQHAPDYSKELLGGDMQAGEYVLLDTYSLPDGSTAFLYRKNAR